MRPLRPHQTRALELLRRSIASGKRRPLLQLPTGAGKTRLAAEIVAGALSKGRKVCFVVPAISLVDQTLESFHSEGIESVGIIQANHWLTDWSQPVQIASVQTLEARNRRSDELIVPDADVVIVDEVHRWSQFYAKWMAHPSAAKTIFVGLSATPWTKGLGQHFDDFIVAATTQELIDAGYLSPFRVYAPSHPDLTGVTTQAGDYHEGKLAAAMNQTALIADVVDTWKRLGADRPTICFGVDRAHAANLQAQFQAAGVPSAYIDGNTEPLERTRIRDAFHAGEIRVVCNCAVLTFGIDWNVSCLILARPTKSESLFVQIIGRGLRTATGKQDCLILDHSDSHLRLGFVTDIHHDELDDGERRKASERKQEEALPRECPKCSRLRPPKVPICPTCGFKAERQSDIKCEDGQLIELKTAKRRASPQERATIYGELRYFQRRHGYKSKWIDHKYKEFFGVWPRGLQGTPEVQPRREVEAWIKSRQIAFAKRAAR